MNPVIEAIKGRRSVRAYLDRPVPRELIEAILDAGNWAPTGNNLQRWRFVVVEDRAFRARLVEAARPTFRQVLKGRTHTASAFERQYFTDFGPKCLGWPLQPFEAMMEQTMDLDDGIYWNAPVIVFVIGPHAAECDLVCENMMLAAHSLGLGTCIVGFGAQVTGDPAIVEALELQEREKIHGPIVVGYPRIVPEAPPKRAPVVKWI
jgi:nitroreductase